MTYKVKHYFENPRNSFVEYFDTKKEAKKELVRFQQDEKTNCSILFKNEKEIVRRYW